MTSTLVLAFVLASYSDLASPDYRTRARAEAWLSRLPARAIPALTILAKDKDPQVAQWAAQELFRRQEAEVQAKADSLFDLLDPKAYKDWSAADEKLNPSSDYPDVIQSPVSDILAALYHYPEIAVRWAARAQAMGLMSEATAVMMVNYFTNLESGSTPAPCPLIGVPTYYWEIRMVWEEMARKAGHVK